jgi:rare lipoprotein A
MPRALALLALAATASGCCLSHRPPRVGDEEEGLASYYAASFEGKPTASGEPYQGEALTCAHRTLPFGTMVEVTAVGNGRSVVVRVNDRGPFVEGRVVDLSRRAARHLGLIQRGAARVRLKVLQVGSGRR